MDAIVATQHNPYIKALYQCLQERGKPKMFALGAAMLKLVHLCFGMLKPRQPYQTTLPFRVDFQNGIYGTYQVNRIAVRFACEWRNEQGQWFRSCGNENWEFDKNGLMHRR